jgi:hypothetical protein
MAQQLEQVGEGTEGGGRGWQNETEQWIQGEGGEPPERRRPSKSAATDERVTAPASAGQKKLVVGRPDWEERIESVDVSERAAAAGTAFTSQHDGAEAEESAAHLSTVLGLKLQPEKAKCYQAAHLKSFFDPFRKHRIK